MAKSPSGPKGPSRIRFVMVDAELGDGDSIAQITQAITNALKPPQTTIVKRLAAPTSNGNGEQHAEPEVIEDEEEELDAIDVTPKPKSPRKPAPTPDILTLDFNLEVPLAAYAAEYKTESHQQRFLVASAWFHDHANITKVTPAHVYTAYRFLKWPLTIKDFAQPLRDLKADKLYGSTEKGTYTINHVGLQRVAELKTSN